MIPSRERSREDIEIISTGSDISVVHVAPGAILAWCRDGQKDRRKKAIWSDTVSRFWSAAYVYQRPTARNQTSHNTTPFSIKRIPPVSDPVNILLSSEYFPQLWSHGALVWMASGADTALTYHPSLCDCQVSFHCQTTCSCLGDCFMPPGRGLFLDVKNGLILCDWKIRRSGLSWRIFTKRRGRDEDG